MVTEFRNFAYTVNLIKCLSVFSQNNFDSLWPNLATVSILNPRCVYLVLEFFVVFFLSIFTFTYGMLYENDMHNHQNIYVKCGMFEDFFSGSRNMFNFKIYLFKLFNSYNLNWLLVMLTHHTISADSWRYIWLLTHYSFLVLKKEVCERFMIFFLLCKIRVGKRYNRFWFLF